MQIYLENFIKFLYLNGYFQEIFLRYLIFLIGKKNVNNWYVLSPVSKKILVKNLKKFVNIKTLNIYNDYKSLNEQKVHQIEYDFIYPASYMEHKNHSMLINILVSLSEKNIFPKVIFTLDPISLNKINFYDLKNKYNLKIFNFYEQNHDEFLKIYRKCKSLLYMSRNETIGLPIIEAHRYGLYIIAPKLQSIPINLFNQMLNLKLIPSMS